MRNSFSLQPALEHKQHLEEACQMELAAIETDCGRARLILETLGELEETGLRELDNHHRAPRLNIHSIAAAFVDVQMLQQRIEQQIRLLDDLEKSRELKRSQLIEVSKGRKALEKLKEKHARILADQLAKAEQKVMEHIATTQFVRRMSRSSSTVSTLTKERVG